MVTKPFLLLVPCAPTTIQVTTVVYQNNSLHDVELFWTHREVKLYNILTNQSSRDNASVHTELQRPTVHCEGHHLNV